MSEDQGVFDLHLTRAARAMSLRLSEQHRRLMWRHFQLLVEANRRFNLTRITSPAEAAVKHYADSLTLLAGDWVDQEKPRSVLDVGTGAGFPAVPLAVMCEAWRVTAIDGTGKKARFVAESAEALVLRNLEARHARSADLVRGGRSTYDLVLLRAVGTLAAGLAEVHELARKDGAIVFYKSAGISDGEIAEGEAEAARHGFGSVRLLDVTLEGVQESIARRLICYRRA